MSATRASRDALDQAFLRLSATVSQTSGAWDDAVRDAYQLQWNDLATNVRRQIAAMGVFADEIANIRRSFQAIEQQSVIHQS